MRKRDLGVLLISAFAVFYTVQDDQGPFSFQKAWYHPIKSNSWDHGSDVLPQPIVADLNGDGEPEIIVATHDAKLQVLAPRPPGRPGEGFAPAKALLQVDLAQWSKAGISATAASIAAGTIDAPAQELVRAFKKQVVVVVTHGWHVLCFDHNLKLLWDWSIQEKLPHHTTTSEVAIHISNHTVHQGDRGLVVVGAASHYGDLSTQNRVRAELEEADPFAEELSIESAEREHRRSERLKEMEGLKNVVDGSVDVSRHFSYYAWEGASGRILWKHQGEDFHRDSAAQSEQVTPQHNYRLDAAALAGRHFGETSCRNYRRSVLQSMPHRWARRGDTRLALSHFHHHKAGQGRRKQNAGAPPERLGVKHVGRQHPTRGRTGTEDTKVATAINKIANRAGSGGQGRPTPGSMADHPTAEHFGHPNVLVAHMREGIEAIHLYTGRSICKLHLPNPGLHGDFNGDGVLDHIQVFGGKPEEEYSRTARGHVRHPPCWATSHSGQPPNQPVFNGTVCRGASSLFGAHLGQDDLRAHDNVHAGVEVAPPTALPVVGRRGRVRRSRAWPVFANSRGEVTAYDSGGELQWQITAGTSWSRSAAGIDFAEEDQTVPTLDAIPLRAGGVAVAVLVAGEHTAALLSEHGNILSHLDLPAPPILPMLPVDFSYDRNVDLILTTRGGYYGFQQVRHLGGIPFSALVACVIVAMAVVYGNANLSGSNKKRRKGRSTDHAE